MALSIKPKFTKAQLAKLIGERLSRFNTAVVMRLAKVGEAFVNDARNNGTYTDRTGNLRSSVGYIIIKDGQQLIGNFLEVRGPALSTDQKSEGKQKAEKVVSEIAQKYPTGYALICVAGMEYAASVESKGYDVITSSAITAKDDLPKQLNELLAKVA